MCQLLLLWEKCRNYPRKCLVEGQARGPSAPRGGSGRQKAPPIPGREASEGEAGQGSPTATPGGSQKSPVGDGETRGTQPLFSDIKPTEKWHSASPLPVRKQAQKARTPQKWQDWGSLPELQLRSHLHSTRR